MLVRQTLQIRVQPSAADLGPAILGEDLLHRAVLTVSQQDQSARCATIHGSILGRGRDTVNAHDYAPRTRKRQKTRIVYRRFSARFRKEKAVRTPMP
jgi:hypothetical protein